ncbi:hypothetical protein H7H78_02150 [Mycobacterium shinjukuense]|uniref:Uncharacterized protein n=1 Tax=Mycobacterium shinjukuense TaxID=398694 RepID=A0A7I7MPR8_9MYCO|nr:sigma factor-like helix-turn-helix DNA-binding protein [Mycobacterium shinjukuense]MCV6984292.1 hypothetical protein [Mycobacterium shinjukuense]ORB63772.1 hypothetical protein BST45_17295 [Mycobacterium shinjukuense]BBX74254.1 hypothetical protein MSHI_21600 [Mycobacterium shinjukuense]
MTEDIAFDDLSPRCWLDAFPWLKGAAEPGSAPWWNDPIDAVGTETRRRRLAAISELAIERLSHWTIGQILPGLPADLELRSLRLPTRGRNALVREGCIVAADLSAVTVESMMDWWYVGIGLVDTILQALADASTSVATPIVTTRQLPSDGARLPPFEPVSLPRWMASVIDDLIHIATWYATVGLPSQTLLGEALPPGTPDEVVKARQHLEALSAHHILGENELELDVAKLFDVALGFLDPRAVHVLCNRLFADDPLTLDELARQHSVTPERIRQIEGKARGTMLSSISGGGPLASIAEAARGLIGTIRPLDELLTLIPALGELVESVGQPAWRVLDRLDDAYEIEEGWCLVPTMTAAEAVTQTQLQEQADQYGVVRIEDLALVETSDLERRPELTTRWLAQCGYVVDGGFVLTRTQSVGDYAAAVLSLNGTPLSSQEIVDRFVFERSAGSVRNAMGLDDRFQRVDRDRWALSEWGMEAYSGIRSLIREQLAQCGGRVKLDELVESITGRYSVSANSVISYASSPPFEQRDGIVRFAGTGRRVRKAPEHTRRFFRHPDGWAYRVRITKDHLRGSGSVAPMAIANILNLQFGQTRQLESPLGPQAVAWTGTQPSFGTIRRFLMDRDIAAGTDAFLVIHDDGTFSFEPAREITGDPLADALSLIGSPMTTDREAARAAVAGAVGLPETAPVISVIGAYRERGDSDIADLLTSVRDFLETGHTPKQPKHSADVDEILDLL